LDITQTNAKPEDYPELYPNKPENFEFKGTEKQFKNFKKSVYDYAESLKIDVQHGKIDNAGKGYYALNSNTIKLRDDLNETEETKVLLHELAHAKMHNTEKIKTKDQNEISSSVKEYQAEMTAYVVSSTFELDSEDYSKKYLANWTKKDIDNKKYIQSIEEVKEVSSNMIEELTSRYNKLEQTEEKEIHQNNNIDVANKIGFLNDEQGENHFEKHQEKELKVTKIFTETKEKYSNNFIELIDETGNKFNENIVTVDKPNKEKLKKWKNGLSGNDWLNENLQSIVTEKYPEKELNFENKTSNELESIDNEISRNEKVPSR